MKSLHAGEWAGVIIALVLAFLLFAVSGIFRAPVQEPPIVEDFVETTDGSGVAGTFPEGEVPEGISDEEAALQ